MIKQARFLEEDAAAGGPGKPGLIAAAKKEDAGSTPEKDPAAATAAGNDAGHADASQDQELIKKIVGEFLGEEHTQNSEAMEMCQSMYQAAKDDGMDDDAAAKCAGHGMKMAQIMGKKKKEADSAKKDEKATEEAAGEEAKKEAGSEETEESAKEEPKESHKEANEKLADELAKLRGENAALKESVRKTALATHLDKLLRESKLDRKTTDEFRNHVKAEKTVEAIDRQWKLFKAGVDHGRVAGRVSLAETAFAITEKSYMNAEEDSGSGSKLSFEDCK